MDFWNWAGDFKLQRFLGNGGFWDAYMAKCPLGNPVCIKRITLLDRRRNIIDFNQSNVNQPITGEIDKKLLEKAEKYAENLRSFRHPNLLATVEENYKFQSIDWGEPIFCLVTELCEGGDLDKLLSDNMKRKEPISRIKIIEWFIQLSSAVSFLHDKGMVHRNITPRNIFFKDKEQSIVKLGGFSRMVSVDNLRTMDHAGNLPYLAPEMITNSSKRNAKSDCWSMGCVFYELLKLKMLMNANSKDEQVDVILYKEIGSLEIEEYEKLFKGMVNRNLDQRMSSAQINQELQSLQD